MKEQNKVSKNEKLMSVNKKMIFAIFCLLWVYLILHLTYFSRDKFIKLNINEVVEKIENSRTEKAFKFKNNDTFIVLNIGLLNSEEIQLGDSIVKKSDSTKINVYRKVNKNWVLFEVFYNQNRGREFLFGSN